MKNLLIAFILLISNAIFANDSHKFHVSMFSVENNTKLKELEITARILIEDLEKVIDNKYNIKSNLGTKKQHVDAKKYLQMYFESHLQFQINNSNLDIKFIGSEIEDGKFVSYLTVAYLEPIKSIQVKNTVLIDRYADHQNIMHFNILNKKNSILFTKSKSTNQLNY